MIERELYMKQIRPFMNRPLIKVIAGIRRCGKSVVLQLIAEELERQGVEKGRIVYMNFESFEWMDIDNAKALYLYIKFRYKPRFICQCDKKKSRPPLSLWRVRSR